MSFWTKLKAALTGADETPAPESRLEPVADPGLVDEAFEAADAAARPTPAAAPEQAAAHTPAAAPAHGPLWEDVYTSRHAWYQREVGVFPGDIMKMRSLFGVWPGGGLFALPADRIEPGLWVYTTFGLTNPDMPATLTLSTPEGDADAAPTLVAKPVQAFVPPPPGAAGYGYEFALVTRAPEQWPLWVLQWAANAELLDDAGLLHRVEDHGGVTVQDIEIDDGRKVNLLIAKAGSPLPEGATLPNGRMTLLVATVITDAEMRWSMNNGRPALLERLVAAGHGQVSALSRSSVV